MKSTCRFGRLSPRSLFPRTLFSIHLRAYLCIIRLFIYFSVSLAATTCGVTPWPGEARPIERFSDCMQWAQQCEINEHVLPSTLHISAVLIRATFRVSDFKVTFQLYNVVIKPLKIKSLILYIFHKREFFSSIYCICKHLLMILSCRVLLKLHHCEFVDNFDIKSDFKYGLNWR